MTDSLPVVTPLLGRPSKRTPEIEAKIIEAVRGGNYIETAANYAGIGKSTLYEWQSRFPDFADAIQKARAEAETRNVTLIQQAARTQWQAAAWYLERSYPSRYGRKDRLDIEHSEAPPIDTSRYTSEELEMLKELLMKGRIEEPPPRLALASGE